MLSKSGWYPRRYRQLIRPNSSGDCPTHIELITREVARSLAASNRGEYTDRCKSFRLFVDIPDLPTVKIAKPSQGPKPATPSFGMAGVCEICGFDRAVEDAHIIPARLGGSSAEFNILKLCPNHHTLFDCNRLNIKEFEHIRDRVHAALSLRSSDPLLNEWRDSLIARYGLSLPS